MLYRQSAGPSVVYLMLDVVGAAFAQEAVFVTKERAPSYLP
jgi:hypothetical protein